jgi:hypothetical protein
MGNPSDCGGSPAVFVSDVRFATPFSARCPQRLFQEVSMKNFSKLALLGAALAFTASSAFATPVTYSTSGVFSASSSDVVTFGNILGNSTTLTFAGISSTTIDAPSNVSFGTVNVATTGSGASGSGSFTLTIDQTVPSVGSGSLVGTLTGSFSENSSTGYLDFSNLILQIGTGQSQVTYTLQQPVGGYELVPPNDNNGNTTIQGNITPAPEPSSLMLLGTGLLGAAGMLFRRRLTA